VAKEIDGDPIQAHRDFAALIEKNPVNAHLRALDLVALEKSGDGAGFARAWDAAAVAGVDPNALLFTPRFSAMLREQKRNPTLPQEARDRLAQAYGAENRRWGRRVN
jgi:hypothetical protein